MGSIAAALVVIVVALLAAYAYSRWQERRRVRVVDQWVRKLLVGRYGRLPNHLSINGFEDSRDPVIVRFNHPITGTRQRMQFSCQGAVGTFHLLSERQEPR